MTKINKEALREAIKIVGSNQKLSESVGVSYKTILDWTSGRSGISIPNALKIEKATNGKIKVKDLLPDFQWEGSLNE